MASSSAQSSSNLESERSLEVAPAVSLGGGSASGFFSIRSTTSCRFPLGPKECES